MKYPNSISKQLEEVRGITESWPVEIQFDEVIKWVLQFDTEDFDLAFRVLKNLNVIGFENLNNALLVAYSKLERMAADKSTRINSKNTLFAGIGDAGKSGAMISYNFRLINELSEENFLDDKSISHLQKGRIENIVLVDDIISTGSQAAGEIRKLMESVLPLGVKNIFLLTAVGMKDGIKKISDETNAHIFSAFEYDVHDTVTSYDSQFYDGIPYEDRAVLKKRLEYYGKKTHKSPLGYGGVGALIVFYYNTPNSTLPIIWSSLSSWLPLFKRVRKINGITSYYKQIDNIQPNPSLPKTPKSELTIFVEGKSDEYFFEAMTQRISKVTGYKKINVISLGGFFSIKLIDNLEKFSTKYIFLPEEDPERPRSYRSKLNETFKGRPHLFVRPFTHYVDLDSALDDSWFRSQLPKSIAWDESRIKEFSMEFERYLLRRIPPSRREMLIKELVQRFPRVTELERLIDNMKRVIEAETSKT